MRGWLLALALTFSGAASAQVMMPGAPLGVGNQASGGASSAVLDATYLRLDATNDPLTGTLSAQTVSPALDDTYDLGDNTHRWRDIYLGGDTLHIGATTAGGDEGALRYDASLHRFVMNALSVGGDIAISATDLIQMNNVNSGVIFQLGLTAGESVLGGDLEISDDLDVLGNNLNINGVTYSWPNSQGAAGTCAVNNGSGTISWTSCASAGTITGSVGDTQVAYGTAVAGVIAGDAGLIYVAASDDLTIGQRLHVGPNSSATGVEAHVGKDQNTFTELYLTNNDTGASSQAQFLIGQDPNVGSKYASLTYYSENSAFATYAARALYSAGAAAAGVSLAMNSVTQTVTIQRSNIGVPRVLWQIDAEGSVTHTANPETGEDPSDMEIVDNGATSASLLKLKANSVDKFVVSSTGALTQDGGAVFNEVSAAVDLRIETNGNANGVFVDGTNDCVGIMTASCSGVSFALAGNESIAATATNGIGITWTAASLTSGALLSASASNNSNSSSAWGDYFLSTTNNQGGAAAVTTGTRIGWTQNTTIAANTEHALYVANLANASSSTDAAVNALIEIENLDSATGNQIVVTNGLLIDGAQITNGLNLSGTFLTNLITATNFSVTQAGIGTFGSNLLTNGNFTGGDASGDTVTWNAATQTYANDTAITLTGGVNGIRYASALSIDGANNRVCAGADCTAPADPMQVQVNQNATTVSSIQNSTAGTAARAMLGIVADSGEFDILSFSGSYTTSGLNIADSVQLAASGGMSGGMVITANAAAPIIFANNAAESYRLNSVGDVVFAAGHYVQITIGTATAPSGDCDNASEVGGLYYETDTKIYSICASASGWETVIDLP